MLSSLYTRSELSIWQYGELAHCITLRAVAARALSASTLDLFCVPIGAIASRCVVSVQVAASLDCRSARRSVLRVHELFFMD